MIANLKNNDALDALLFSLRQQKIVYSLYLLIFLIFTYIMIHYVFLQPAYIKHEHMVSLMNTERQQIKVQMQKNRLSKHYPALQKSTTAIYNKINYKLSQSELTSQLNKICEQHDITVLSESSTQGKTVSGFQVLYQKVIFESSYHSLREFLLDIQSLPTWIEVSDITISEAESSPDLVNATITLTIYSHL